MEVIKYWYGCGSGFPLLHFNIDSKFTNYLRKFKEWLQNIENP